MKPEEHIAKSKPWRSQEHIAKMIDIALKIVAVFLLVYAVALALVVLVVLS